MLKIGIDDVNKPSPTDIFHALGWIEEFHHAWSSVLLALFKGSRHQNKRSDSKKLSGSVLGSYVDNRGKSVDSIKVCSHGKNDFRILNDKEFHELQRKEEGHILNFKYSQSIFNI